MLQQFLILLSILLFYITGNTLQKNFLLKQENYHLKMEQRNYDRTYNELREENNNLRTWIISFTEKCITGIPTIENKNNFDLKWSACRSYWPVFIKRFQ